MKVSKIDWATWTPRETATLMFVRMDGMVLLIRKLMGMGAGLINAPGGRVDPGETPEQGAIREAQEELHVTPIGGREAGVLAFQFKDGYSLRCHVFTASARATRACRVIAFGRPELAKLMEDTHFASIMFAKLATLISHRLRDAQVQLLSLKAQPVA